MVVGLGIDLCSIERMRRALTRGAGRFTSRVFTPAERGYCDGRANPAQHYAARFAAKEALLKALRVPSGLSWQELEVTTALAGAPQLLLHGAAAAAATRQGIARLHLSLTHTDDTAAAVVIAESADPTPTADASP
jgi:holo-[acyl-carrier protein] synthase